MLHCFALLFIHRPVSLKTFTCSMTCSVVLPAENLTARSKLQQTTGEGKKKKNTGEDKKAGE